MLRTGLRHRSWLGREQMFRTRSALVCHDGGVCTLIDGHHTGRLARTYAGGIPREINGWPFAASEVFLQSAGGNSLRACRMRFGLISDVRRTSNARATLLP